MLKGSKWKEDVIQTIFVVFKCMELAQLRIK